FTAPLAAMTFPLSLHDALPICSLCSYARVNPFGFIETPYRKVVDGRVTDQVDYLTADEEDRYVKAQANAKLDENGYFVEEKVLGRRKGGEVELIDPMEIDYMDVSPRQMVSVATAMIPFLEHADANRALMGAAMQRQAVPLLRSESPLVGTGVELRAAVDAGDVVQAEQAGVVEEVSADLITIMHDDGTRKSYGLYKFRRSNQGTCMNHKPVVNEGDRVEKARSSRTGRRRRTARWRSARTCSWRSCRGRVTTTRTPSSSPSGWCRTTCSPRSTSRSTRSTHGTPSS